MSIGIATVRGLSASAISLLSALALGWGYLPSGRQAQNQTIVPAASGPSSAVAGWTLALELPRRLRLGDAEVVQLRLGDDAAVLAAGQQPPPPLIAEARLDLPGLDVQPADLISEPLLPGGSATFYWSVRAAEPGRYAGTAWVHVRSAEASAGDPERAPIAAQPIYLSVESLLRLSGAEARALGTVGALAGVFLIVPSMSNRLRHTPRAASSRQNGRRNASTTEPSDERRAKS